MPRLTGTDDEILKWAIKATRLIVSRGQRFGSPALRRTLRELGAPIQSENPLFYRGISLAQLLAMSINGVIPPRPQLARAVVAGTDDDPDGAKVWERLREHHENVAHEAADPKELAFPEDRPLVILAMGDAHIGSQAADYERLAWVQEQARRGKCYLLHIGDFLDEMILPWGQHELAEQRSSVREQVAAAAHWLAGCGDRMIAMVAGNHDLWAASRTGLAHIEHALAAAGVKPLYSRGELRIGLTVGPKKIRYEVVIRHKVRGNSQFRASHGVDRWHLFNERDGDADVVIAGHTHRSGVSSRRMHGRMRYGVQLGAYKVSALDSYATVEGFPDENESPDMVLVFRHDQHKIVIYEDSREALRDEREARPRRKKARRGR